MFSHPEEYKFFPEMRRIARQAFLVLERAWALEGGTLVDYKVEFGFDAKGRLLLADVIDNNSWRVLENGAYIDKQVYRDGGALDTVAAKYRQVAEITGHFRVPRQRIILWRGSESDKTEAFAEALGDSKDMMTVVTCSVHKEPIAGASILNKLIQEVPDRVVIAFIGRSNGAGPVLSAQSTVPVITVPASAKDFPEDVWSSLRAPSKMPVMTVLEPATRCWRRCRSSLPAIRAIYAKVRGGHRKPRDEHPRNLIRSSDFDATAGPIWGGGANSLEAFSGTVEPHGALTTRLNSHHRESPRGRTQSCRIRMLAAACLLAIATAASARGCRSR